MCLYSKNSFLELFTTLREYGAKKSVGLDKNLRSAVKLPEEFLRKTSNWHSLRIRSSALIIKRDNWLTKVDSVFCV